MPMTKKEIDRFLSQPHVAVVAVTAPDGHPHAVPTWYEYRNGTVTFHTDKSAFKYTCLSHDPFVTLVVDTKQPPYKAVILKGRARMVEKIDDQRLQRMAAAYLGPKDGLAYARSLKGSKVVVVSLRAKRQISWDYSRERP